MAKNALTPKQERFVREYLTDLNATRAAKAAGYGPRGAHVTGSRLLKDPKVRAALEAAEGARSERTQITADNVLRQLWNVATSDVAKAFDADGRLLPIQQ